MTRRRHGCAALGAWATLSCLVASCAGDPAPCDPSLPACAEPTWASIHAVVVTRTCTFSFCHGDAEGNNEAGLDLRGVDESYARLFTVSTSDECGALGLPLIEPGDPERSLLYQKLFAVDATVDDAAICGYRMPYSGEPLPDQWRTAIRVWIEDGAPGP